MPGIYVSEFTIELKEGVLKIKGFIEAAFKLTFSNEVNNRTQQFVSYIKIVTAVC